MLSKARTTNRHYSDITKHDWNKGTCKTITQQDSKFKENKLQRTKNEDQVIIIKIIKHDWNKGTSKTITQQDSKFKDNKLQR